MDLRRLAAEHDLSLSELAREAGVGRSTVHRLAEGAPGRPSTRRRLRLALERYPRLEPPPEPISTVVPKPAPTQPPSERAPLAIIRNPNRRRR